MPVRLLGVQIAHGLSPEARVFAGLLANRDPQAVEARALCHEWEGDPSSASAFGAISGASVQPLDFGWRSVASGRSLADKARARLRFWASLPRALALARAANPDVIYSCQQQWDCQAATYIARKLGKPQIIHLHYIVGPWLHQPVLARLRECAHVVTVSEFIREEALRHGVAPSRVTTVRNTLDVPAGAPAALREAVRAEFGIAPDAPLVGIAARLDPGKGQADTLRAFAPVAREFPTATLLVIGGETPWHSGYGEQLKALASELGIDRQVRFLGHRADLPRLLLALDIFAHPSRQEPFGLAMLEASAAGVPVVAYAEGGAKEVVAHGITGLLTPPEDIGALTLSLRRLISDRAEAHQMGDAGRARVCTEFRPAAAGAEFSFLVCRVAQREKRVNVV